MQISRSLSPPESESRAGSAAYLPGRLPAQGFLCLPSLRTLQRSSQQGREECQGGGLILVPRAEPCVSWIRKLKSNLHREHVRRWDLWEVVRW